MSWDEYVQKELDKLDDPGQGWSWFGVAAIGIRAICYALLEIADAIRHK